ncbi:glycosyltransferase family 2 protein [Methylotuvimicrobium sp. KM1]|uniref:glycosyltransferase family 2 protein n=1 Tax=Methylotuvimicrobium sp. KM1 TaxID=3377707 RepID=UPI00384AEE90
MSKTSSGTLLSQLPSAPKGKKGWPWTEEHPLLPATMPNGESWPKISIVTPSFNQGQFIEETIRSVLLQNYPNLEYVIIDGGSTDESIEIIRKYEPWLTYWVSESDKGQSHAINKGFEKCSGDIYNWLCSDDILLKDALKNVAHLIDCKQPCWLIGAAFVINKKGYILNKNVPLEPITITTFLKWSSNYFYQPSTFWNRHIFSNFNRINNNLHYCMDVDLWFKFFNISKPKMTNVFLSSARCHEQSKTSGIDQADKFIKEFSIWVSENIFFQPEHIGKTEIIDGIISIQSDLSKFSRIKNHAFFKYIFKWWRILINKNFPIR